MTYDNWKARNHDDECLNAHHREHPDYEQMGAFAGYGEFDDAGIEHEQSEQLLIGPLAHIKHRSAFGFDYYTVDFSKPGALERYAAEEGEWWSKNWDKDCIR